MKVYDASLQSTEALKEAFVQKEFIKIENILYVSECHTPKGPGELDVCQLCRFNRVKGMCKSHISDKVCSACGHADLEVNFCASYTNIFQREREKIKLHYLQRPT